MLATTFSAVRSILTADPSVDPPERNRLLSLLRQGRTAEPTTGNPPARTGLRLMRRGEVAERLSVSLRTVDRLAKAGALPKRKLPGRTRAGGFLEADVVTLLTEGVPHDEAE